MKKFILLIFLFSCSFEAKKKTLDVKYLNVKDFTLGEYKISLDDYYNKKELIK